MFKYILSFSVLVVPAAALATSDVSPTIVGVGAQLPSAGYILLSQTSNVTCNNILYVDLKTDGGRALISIAMTIRASGKPAARVDYEIGESGLCWANLIQM